LKPISVVSISRITMCMLGGCIFHPFVILIVILTKSRASHSRPLTPPRPAPGLKTGLEGGTLLKCVISYPPRGLTG
jgi:hypothetical protein